MIYKPHPYQEYAERRIVEGGNVGLFLSMGLGKSVITLTAVDELIYDRLEVSRVLVIAPKKVAEATWQAEILKWDHLRRLTVSTALGSARQREEAIRAEADITIINRENVVWLAEWCEGNTSSGAPRHLPLKGKAFGWPFDMVVVDESSSFKNPGAKRFKALKRMLTRIRRMVILTGTPAPNGIEDLWSQIYLLDRGERLGRYVTHYRERYFDHNPWRHEYVPKPGAFEAVQKRISDICVSMKAEDWLTLPEMIVDDVPVALDGEARKKYREMERTMCMEIGDTSSGSSGHLPLKGKAFGDDGEGMSGERSEPEPASAAKQDAGETRDPQSVARARGDIEISAATAAALTGKLLQLCGGCVYDEDGNAHHVHDAKLEALEEVLEQLHGEHALLFYGYRHELPGLRAVALQGGRRVRELKGAEDAEAWNRGEVDVLLAHPASCAYGLNLQDGGRHVIWYTLTWSLELYQQANARLHRQGQRRPVIVHRLLVQGGVDQDVAKALEGKDETQAALVEALKARIERVVG